MTKHAPRLSPKQCKPSKLHTLQRDNIDTPRSWFLLQWDEIIITNQKMGEQSTGSVRLTRRDFEKFVRFYEREQRVRTR